MIDLGGEGERLKGRLEDIGSENASLGCNL